MPAIFGDHMVLQQGVTTPVWGKASPGEKISLTYQGQFEETKADSAGNWRITLRPQSLSKFPGILVINGTNRLEFDDVVVGDVWVCAGEGSMALPLDQTVGGRVAASVGDRELRLFRRDAKGSGRWDLCDPESASKFSGVGFYFARDIRASRQVPVGMIEAARADTPISRWMPDSRSLPSAFRDLIAPLIPYPITGIIWSQGESERGDTALQYRRLLPRLIRAWRAAWKQGPFPFYALSLPGSGEDYGPPVDPSPKPDGGARGCLPWVREGTDAITSLPNTGVAVATDLGVPRLDPSPKGLEIGRRLARLARHRYYGDEVKDAGPDFRSMKIEKEKVRLRFDTNGDHLSMGLPDPSSGATLLAASLKGFAIAGADHKWFPAVARIEGEEIVLRSDAVKEPKAVRYNWRDFPVGNLYNKSGLPVAPFRTDTDQP